MGPPARCEASFFLRKIFSKSLPHASTDSLFALALLTPPPPPHRPQGTWGELVYSLNNARHIFAIKMCEGAFSQLRVNVKLSKLQVRARGLRGLHGWARIQRPLDPS